MMQNDHTINMQFSQSLMKTAVEYFLRHQLIRHDVSVSKVEIDTTASSSSVDHFKVSVVLPIEQEGDDAN